MLCDILTFLYTDTSRVIFDTVDDRCLIISPNTSVDCTGEETALSQCSSSLSISEICQYLLVDCNPRTDIDPNIDPPNNEESTEETDTGNDDDDRTPLRKQEMRVMASPLRMALQVLILRAVVLLAQLGS